MADAPATMIGLSLPDIDVWSERVTVVLDWFAELERRAHS